ILQEIFRHSLRSRGHPPVPFALLSRVLLSTARNRAGWRHHSGLLFLVGAARPASNGNSYFARWHWCGSGSVLCFISHRFSGPRNSSGHSLHGLSAGYDPDLAERPLLVPLL